jgi:hypothetical protein
MAVDIDAMIAKLRTVENIDKPVSISYQRNSIQLCTVNDLIALLEQFKAIQNAERDIDAVDTRTLGAVSGRTSGAHENYSNEPKEEETFKSKSVEKRIKSQRGAAETEPKIQ